MADEYKYYMEDGKMHRVSIEYDEYGYDPREDESANLGVMCCQWGNYTLGDRQDLDSDDLKRDMIEAAGITVEDIIKYIKDGNCKGYWIEYDNDEEVWKFGGGFYDEIIDWDEDSSFYDSYFIDDAIEALTIQDILNIADGEIVALNLYIYEHSGLAMSCDSFIGRAQHAEWDSGCAGFIWSTVSRAKKETGYNFKTDEEWQEYLAQRLADEVKEYDMFLENECYMYTDEVFDEDTYDWYVEDSCGGYYSEEWGEALWDEVMADAYGSDMKFYDTAKEAKEAA